MGKPKNGRVKLRMSVREAKQWLTGFRQRRIPNFFDKRSFSVECFMSADEYVDLCARWPEARGCRCYFGDELDAKISEAVKRAVEARS